MSGHSKWSTIKHKKGAADARRGKLFSKLSRAIMCPHCDEGDPEEIIVPLGAIRELRIAAPSHDQALGFAGSTADA